MQFNRVFTHHIKNKNIKHCANGFSLIELIIVIVIIGILSRIIYPSYRNHVVRARRIYATVVLLDAAARLEQYYINNNSYVGATIDKLGIEDANTKQYYTIALTTTDSAYTLKAIPKGQQAQLDNLCGTFGLDEVGNKFISGTGKIPECWVG